ncbi:elongator complex protein 1 [Papilio machaon]|uniref:elongator complex protein 1 n=1 Tax=Papilio machaon TaxID=76193 RepID=UPI001E6661E5|nr:elongator complex protein 1 [Papilio machaon]
MKNLELWEVNTRGININSKEKFHLCYNYDGENTVKFFAVTHNLQVSNIDESGAINWTKDISEITNCENIPVNITYISLSNQLCIALANGELITIDESGSDYELVGVFENGLMAMEWSPDQDILVLVTKDLKMITMSCTFDPISEVELLSDDFGKKEFITVGWGKKETQFHGSVGKQAAKQKLEFSDENESTDSRVKITWRGDGNLFAVGFAMNGLRRFKVFDREGNLQYTSEKQPGLECNLSWRPSGNLIATTQKINNNYVIAFFEKNGLKHGEFKIPVNSKTIVEDLYWSPDSEILTLSCKDLEDNTQKILLFTTSNYHWYQKQIMIFHDAERIDQIFWDNDFDVASNKKLHIVLQNGKHFIYSWIWTISHSRGKNSEDDAMVAVIDGRKLLLTGFRQTVVPPPMASLVLELDSDIHSVHFAPPHMQNNHNCITNSFFVNTEEKLIFFEQTQKFPLQYKTVKTINKDVHSFPFQIYNWYWLNCNTIVAAQVDKLNCYNLIEYDISNEVLSQSKTVPLPAPVVRLHSDPIDPSTVFLQLNTGEIMKYSSGKNVTIQDISFKTSCSKFDIVFIQNKLHFLGLSQKGNLYIDNVSVLNNVSSYFVHTSFLLITTLQHYLLCTELSQTGFEAITEYQKNDSPQVYKRKIERGAKLVISVPNATNTIFQMPRGNLETIQPRPLSLKIIGEQLDSLDYEKAFDLMRKQRINLNLIYDHNPKLFLDNIDKFLDSIKNTSWLCLFLSDLENSDVTKTMYKSSYKNNVNNESMKIQEICDIVQTQINKRSDRSDKILPLLTTYIKKNTIEDLEKALLIIKEIKVHEMGNNKLAVGSDEAIRFLLYMVNVDELFNVALGMYDFDLVLLVANKSQKDPKEYIPMLNELNGMDDNYKKFSINKYLKRFDKAVKYLVKCGSDKYEELKAFVKYHSLYKEALALFNENEDIYKEIADDFGLYLKLKKDFVEAGVVYERSKNYIKAVDCYKEALEWELALSVVHHLTDDQRLETCRYLVDALKDEKRHKEALTILEQHLQNGVDAIIYAIENGQYKTAIRLLSKYNRPDLREQRLLPALLEEYQNLKGLIENNLKDFIKHRTRLSEVRENKLNKADYMYDAFNTNKDDDLYSDAGSTIASSGSGRSFRSSKNRRKHQRKVASLKEGSQYEDVALIMTLHSLVTSSFNLRLQVKDVNVTLSVFNKDKMASELQKNLDNLLNEMRSHFKEIWTNDLVLQATKAAIDAENIPEGSNVIADSLSFLEPHVRIAPVIQDISWKLEGLS